MIEDNHLHYLGHKQLMELLTISSVFFVSQNLKIFKNKICLNKIKSSKSAKNKNPQNLDRRQ